jgi:hypothetical protein
VTFFRVVVFLLFQLWLSSCQLFAHFEREPSERVPRPRFSRASLPTLCDGP